MHAFRVQYLSSTVFVFVSGIISSLYVRNSTPGRVFGQCAGGKRFQFEDNSNNLRLTFHNCMVNFKPFPMIMGTTIMQGLHLSLFIQ